MSRFLRMLLDAAHGGDHAMITGEPAAPVRRPWSDVHATACRMAAGLLNGDDTHAALSRGASVGVLAAEPASIAPAAQAVWLTGGSVTMLHQPTARTDLAAWAEDTVSVLKMINAEVVLLGAPFDALAPVLTERGIAFRHIETLGTGGSSRFADIGTGGSSRFAATGAVDSIDPDATVADEGDTALLQLTSGSTAEPKAVRITHGNLHANITAMMEATRLDIERDVMVSWLPLFHDMGMVGFLTVPMATGLELVTVTPVDFLTRPLLWAELISKYGGTVTAAPNFAYAVLGRQLVRADGQLDLSSLRIALNGAEPVDPDAVAAFTDAGARFGLRASAVLCAYGMAETALGVAFAPIDTGIEVDEIDAEQLEAHRRAVLTTAGQTTAGQTAGRVRRFPKLGPPLPGIDVRVMGDDATVLGEREVGVLQLRGPSVTPGYLTADGPVDAQDSEGWFDTGDEGYLVDGQVVVCGRRKDVIIMGGRNIYPTDIERAAAEAPDVRAGNVVAVRLLAGSDRHRESFLVAVESRRADDPEAVATIARNVVNRVVSAVGVRPAEVVVLGPGSLPKTPSGKLRRAATGEMLRRR